MKKRLKKKCIQFAIFGAVDDIQKVMPIVADRLLHRCFPHHQSSWNTKYADWMTGKVLSTGLLRFTEHSILLTPKFKKWCRSICPHYYAIMYGK